MPKQAIDNKGKKRGAKVLAVAGGLVLIGGVAFAYWTQGGSGTGTASTGDTDAITVNQTSTVEGLAPGVPAQTLSGNFTNPNDGPVYVTSVTVEIDSVTGGAGDCDESDYTLANATMPVNAEIPVGTGGSWGGATLAFNNKADVNQDGCKGATVNLAYTAS